ncbi:stage II sporulation protein E [Bacteroides sp. 214]|uniref:SpoIIE family protein phosphatase n=1 Tax=Bacteroides sp. 214 TaxID=2302935 RepID=UPI0013D2DA0E|nr:SpoIIE family protein phosphatase [Bacteroides sp. 214]NDW13749.1 stage II sporulation protein E [Bacteroides sp. 214]
MRTNGSFVEIECAQRNKAGEIVCGDTFLCKKLKEEGRIICVLSDGLGSGVKANMLSTVTASMALNYSVMHEDIIAASSSIIKTLPIDQWRKISYSTFCICEIDYLGNTRIVEYESPSFYLYRGGEMLTLPKQKIPVERDDIENTELWISEFTMEREDRIVFFSDGVSQSGIGTSQYPFGWGSGIKTFLDRTFIRTPDISAATLAGMMVGESYKNDGYAVKDDTTCAVIYMRTPRNLLVSSGPPFDEQDDCKLSRLVEEFNGKKVICGGTTAQIIGRELDRDIAQSLDLSDPDLPPISTMQGIDLITEGILTLSKVESLLLKPGSVSSSSDSPAELLLRHLMTSDKITFLVGTKINIAHQDPSLPVELEIRRNVIKRIAHILGSKYFKDTEIVYI